MKVENKHEIQTYCPCFSGFYETLLSTFDDSYIEQSWDYEYIKEKVKSDDLTNKIWDFIRDNYSDYFNYKDLHIDISKKVVDFYNDNMDFYFGNDCLINFEFESLYSPKEYNFSTDSINIKVNFDDRFINILKNYIKSNIEDFEEYIKNRYTSCSGFTSFYSNDYKTWLDYLNFIYNLKSNEHYLGTFLDFYFENENSNITEDIYFYCYGHYLSNGNIENFFDFKSFYNDINSKFNIDFDTL